NRQYTQYTKMSRKQKEEVHRKIDESLEQLSVEERRKLEKELEVERLSGRTLMTMLSAGGGVVLVATLVLATGFGAYMVLTTIIHAVMTTFLGITVPFAVYTSATTILSILLGPIGLMVMLLTVVGFSGHRGQRRIDHLMLAYVVTQSHVAAGPETEPEEDFEESVRHSEMAVELHRLQKDVEAYEGLLEQAAKKEERGYRTIQRLEARVAALEEREGTEEKVAALNAEIEELKQQLEIERNEKAALEAQSSRQKALLER